MAKTLLIFGEMDKSPGVRFRVANSAVTYAEYLRDICLQRVTNRKSRFYGR